MSELEAGVIVTPHDEGMCFDRGSDVMAVTERETEFYLKSEADAVIAEKDKEIAELKNGIAPKQSDKTLQERLNEVCKKYAVSTLQDLDWAFCESEKGRARDFIEAVKAINHQKYRRFLAMAMWCWCVKELNRYGDQDYMDFAEKWRKRWLELAEKFKEAK